MESLASYESDDENKEHPNHESMRTGAIVTSSADSDTNYDDVGMDESDEESNNNVPGEFYQSNAFDQGPEPAPVCPEDAPLVFRSQLEIRDEVRSRSLERRNSSDMDMDDGESEDLEEEAEEDEKEENDLDYDQNVNMDPVENEAERYTGPNQDVVLQPALHDLKKETEVNDSQPASSCPSLGKNQTRLWESRLGRTKRKEDERASSENDAASKEKSRHYGIEHKPIPHSRHDSVYYKRPHSPDRSSNDERGSHHRATSPERTWKSARLEKKTAALTKMGIELRPEGDPGRPLVGGQLRSQIKQVEAKTGITLPSYYNPAIMNPIKYAQQIQKRKLIWGNKGNEAKPKESLVSASSSPWDATTFKGDNDGKMTEKFKRLMGMKAESTAVSTVKCEQKDIIEKQEAMFSNMEAQYQVARTHTHMHRGIGLGYGTHPIRPSLHKTSTTPKSLAPST